LIIKTLSIKHLYSEAPLIVVMPNDLYRCASWNCNAVLCLRKPGKAWISIVVESCRTPERIRAINFSQ